jgi:beta-galactosidase
LEYLRGTWELIRDGEVLQSGQLPILKTQPGSSSNLQIPFAQPHSEYSGEYWLMMRFYLVDDKAWAKAGHEVAWEQFKLSWLSRDEKRSCSHSAFPLSVKETAGEIVVVGNGFELEFNRKTGVLARYDWKKVALIKTGPMLNVWRAATDNDGFKWDITDPSKLLYRWLQAGFNRIQHNLEKIEVEQPNPDLVCLKVGYTSMAEGLQAGFLQNISYRIYANAGLEIDLQVKCFGELPPLPRLGLTMSLPEGFETFTWLGRGPGESYSDRKAGVPVGLYHSTVDDQFVPYILPQEHGNKTDVRWAALSNAEGQGLLVMSEPLMEVSASHFTADDLYQAMHTNELVRRPETILNLDLAQCGLGGNSCGPATLDKYLIWPGEFRLRLMFRPYDSSDTLTRVGRC